MRSTAAFEHMMKLRLDRYRPPEVQRVHAALARRGKAEFISRMPVKPTEIKVFVDGREGVSEDAVRPYGVIRYEFFFHRPATVAATAMKRCVDLSPVKSGAYKSSWFCIADGAVLPYGAAPPVDAKLVVVTNDADYHRKLEVTVNAGSTRVNSRGTRVLVPSGICERVRAEIARLHGREIDVDVRFIALPGGYTLTGSAMKRAKTNSQSAAFRAGRAFLALRKDTRAGERMTYPAIVIRRRGA